jgi:hypothetical protein
MGVICPPPAERTVAITPYGVVAGSCEALVTAAAEALHAVPAPRVATENRLADLAAALRAPWDCVPVRPRVAAA